MSTDVLVRPNEIEARAEEAAALLKALANPQRLRLACELVEGERGVGELEELTGIRQPTLSKELGKLREVGLIEGRREAKAVFYSLVEPRVVVILAALCGRGLPPAPPPPRRDAVREQGSIFARILPNTN